MGLVHCYVIFAGCPWNCDLWLWSHAHRYCYIQHLAHLFTLKCSHICGLHHVFCVKLYTSIVSIVINIYFNSIIVPFYKNDTLVIREATVEHLVWYTLPHESVHFILLWYFFRIPLLQTLIGFFELPEDDSVPDDEHFIDIEDTPGILRLHFFTITYYY